MTRPAAATWETSSAQITVEYVKGRRVLRLAVGDSDRIEVALDDFCASLGIDVAQLAPPQRYLLFAGVGDGPGASPRHVVATYRDEQGAREAFRALRLGHCQPTDWAEVAVVEASGGLRQLCWFGTPWGPGGRNTRASTISHSLGPWLVPVRALPRRRRPWRTTAGRPAW